MSADGTTDLAAAIQEVRQSLETAAQFDDPYASVTTQTLKDLLAAVSRPAEARGEPVAWAVRRTDAPAVILHVTLHQPNADALASMQGVEVVPLYAHPAPSGGEARRTETYPHDCGCETCPEHTRAQPGGKVGMGRVVRHADGRLSWDQEAPPTAEDAKPLLASIAKAYPYLVTHASHLDGEFDNALTGLRALIARFERHTVPRPAPRAGGGAMLLHWTLTINRDV